MSSFINKADQETKRIIKRILNEGSKDINPRPIWKDGTPAHTYSINHDMVTFDLTKGEFPIMTLRPMPIKLSIGELLWIYQDQSNDLDLLAKKYNVTWWNAWDIGNRTIGACYGETVRRHGLMDYLLNNIKTNPDSRYHIINLWQVDDFKEPHGLKPCCFQTNFNVAHGEDGIDYLDMIMYQRSVDFLSAGSAANWIQYATFLCLVAKATGYVPRKFTWVGCNIQIYDRHLDAARELLERESIDYKPELWLNPEKTDFYSFTMDDIKTPGYPRKEISEKNPQLTLEIAI